MDSRRRYAMLALGLAALLVLAVAGCGGSDDGGGESDGSAATQETTETAPTDSAPAEVAEERPGCGELCQQAAPPAGTDDFGCPRNDSDLCEPCPEGGCAEVLSDSADVEDGIVQVELRCVVDHDCTGALKLYVPGTLSNPLAASDVSVPANDSATVAVALTPRGRQVVAYEGEVTGDSWAFFEGTGTDELGDDIVGGPPVTLRGERGSFTDCGGGIAAGRNTSCPFAQNVARAFEPGTGGQQFDVESPTTGRSYSMTCDPHEGTGNVYCTGGDDAFVVFPDPSP